MCGSSYCIPSLSISTLHPPFPHRLSLIFTASFLLLTCLSLVPHSLHSSSIPSSLHSTTHPTNFLSPLHHFHLLLLTPLISFPYPPSLVSHSIRLPSLHPFFFLFFPFPSPLPYISISFISLSLFFSSICFLSLLFHSLPSLLSLIFHSICLFFHSPFFPSLLCFKLPIPFIPLFLFFTFKFLLYLLFLSLILPCEFVSICLFGDQV